MIGEELAQPESRPTGRAALPPREAVAAPWLSVERLLYGVALVIGGWLRLWFVGQQPLSPWEASNSWPAWLMANGLQVVDAPTPTSALYYGLQWLLFWAGVNNDGGARFVSVVVGAGMIVLPWWWRSFLGRRVALILAFLIALDAWLLHFSRLADGAVVALTLGLLTLIAMSQVAQQPTNLSWKRAAAISFGLLLVAGPMGWNMLPVVVWWGWLLYGALAAAGLLQRQWLVWVGGAAMLGATFLFARLDALAWVASGMSVWLSQVDGRSAGPLLPMVTGGYDVIWPWMRLWVDAALLLPFGSGGLVALAWRARALEAEQPQLRLLLHLCMGWLLWGVVLNVLPGRSPLALPVLGLPLLILSAYALDGLLRTVPSDLDWREAGAVVLTITILLVSGMFWLAALLAGRSYDPVLAQAALVIFGLAVAILVAFGIWANRRDAAWVAASLLAVLLIMISFRSSWKLNFGSVVIEPAGWQATTSHPEVRLLVGDMETISSHRSGDPHQLPVQVQVAAYATRDDQTVPARPDPVVGWALRNMRNLTWVTSPSVPAESNPLPLVVTPATGDDEMPQLDLPNTYAGSRYHVDAWWLPSTLRQDRDEPQVTEDGNWARLWTAALQPWWRWFVYREPTLPPQNRDVILWAPLDLTSAQ